MNTLEFLKKALLAFTSSLNLSEVLENIFCFLVSYFPLEGFAIHKYFPENKSIFLMYFVNKNGCIHIEKQVNLSIIEQAKMKKIEQSSELFHGNLEDSSMIDFLSASYKKYLGSTQCQYLGSILRTNSNALGSLLFFSKKDILFDASHVALFELLIKPFTSVMMNLLHYQDVLNLQNKLASENMQLNQNIKELKMNEIIGISKDFRKVADIVHLLSEKETPVLILGETGTGKEVIADLIQSTSKRKNKIFIKVNCGALPENLVDSELFGYEKGSFTGAFEAKKGKFEQADGGTLFLDEIGELPLQAQVRFLRVLQFGLVEKVGGTKPIPINIRIIAATNRNLEDMLQKGLFREDLYYRLHVFPINLPPLRKRQEDIPSFLAYFTQKIAFKYSLPVPLIDYTHLSRLQAYSWPGNVRELQNLVERTLILNPASPVDFSQHLPLDAGWYLDSTTEISNNTFKNIIKECITEMNNEKIILNEPIEVKSANEFLKQQIIDALKVSNGKVYGKNGAAELLGVNYHTLKKRIVKLNINCKKLWE